ncbi:MAG: hypothetical protein ACRDHW_06080, partial [Ktedonobacteraceae bacterium]
PTGGKASKPVATVGNATVSPSGNFDVTFTWPAAANQVNKGYSICSLLASNGSVVSSLDDGPFTVLAATPPTLNISVSHVAAGGMLTVSGKNWVPPQPLNIDIAGCADCDPHNSTVATTTTSSAGLNSGIFNLTVPIPATTPPGNYVVNVFSQSGPLDAFHLSTGVQHLTITAPPVTPTVVASPSVTASATAITTPTGSTTGSNNSGSSNGNNSFLVIVLIAMVFLLLAIAGLVFYMLALRKRQNSPPGGPSSYPGNGQFNPQSMSGGPMTPLSPGPGQQMNQQRQFNNSSNSGYRGNNNQFWQNNPPSQAGYNDVQQGQPSAQRTCMRCGSPLSPHSAVCGRCGMQHMATSDHDSPTIAY